MRVRTTFLLAALAALAAAALALAAADSTQVQKPGGAQPAGGHEGHSHGAPAAAQAGGAPAVTLGKRENVKWSATTLEAATAEANKEILEKGEPKTITGEVVDVSCYLQLGKRGEGHIDCGTMCLRSGEQVGILEPEGELYLVFAEEHHPRRDGQTDINKVFIPLLAKTVTVSGMEVELKGYEALFVSAEELGALKKTGNGRKAASGAKTTGTKK